MYTKGENNLKEQPARRSFRCTLSTQKSPENYINAFRWILTPSSANERPHTYALDGMATGISEDKFRINNLYYELRFATGCTVRDSISVRARFSATAQNGPGAHPASYTMGTESFPEVKRPELCVDHPPHPVPKLKEE